MRSHQVHPFLLEIIIQSITVIGVVPNEMLGLGLQHVEVDTELDQRDFMMVRGMCAGGKGEPMAIDNRQDFHVPPEFGQAHGLAATGRAAEMNHIRVASGFNLLLTPCRQFQRRVGNGNREALLDAGACLLPGKGTIYKQLPRAIYQAVGKSIYASSPTGRKRHGHSS